MTLNGSLHSKPRLRSLAAISAKTTRCLELSVGRRLTSAMKSFSHLVVKDIRRWHRSRSLRQLGGAARRLVMCNPWLKHSLPSLTLGFQKLGCVKGGGNDLSRVFRP